MGSTGKVVVVDCVYECCILPSKFRCGGCNLANYCSKEHQKADWKNHKKACSTLTLQSSTELGRHYVTSRNLKAGTLLLSEDPLLVEPLARGYEEFYKTLQTMIENQQGGCICVCLACSTPTDGKKCPNCNWPICSIECSKAKIHADNECPLFVKNALNLKIDRMDQEVLVGVFLIRGLLLKKSQPEIWDKIQDLQFEASDKTIGGEREDFPSIVSRFQKKFKKIEQDIGEDFMNTEELVKLCGILKHNAFLHHFNHEERRGKTTTARILYLKSSMFSHGCFANCSWGVTCGPVFKIEIRTAVDIPKGQVLSIAYSPRDFMMGSVKRNIDEMKRGNFNCHCARCLDPTELNSMMSAVKCTKGDCTDGYLIPKDSKNFSPTSIWACMKCGDKSANTLESLENVVKRAENMINKFQVYKPKKIEDLLNILRKHLHSNHWVIQQFCRQVMRELYRKMRSGNTEEDVRDYFFEIARYVVQVSQLTMPGLSYYKAEYQFMLFQALFTARFEIISSINTGHIMDELAQETSDLLDHLLVVKKMEPTSKTNDGGWNPVLIEVYGKRAQFDCMLGLPKSELTNDAHLPVYRFTFSNNQLIETLKMRNQ